MAKGPKTQPPEHSPEAEQWSVVVVGSFNPAIFHPAWFLERGLISSEIYDESEVVVVRPEVSEMNLGPFEFQCARGRLQVMINEPTEHAPLLDLILGVLTLLPETPVWAAGMNHQRHFKAANEDRWNALGDALVPKEPWQDVLNSPGMRALSMIGKRDDEFHGYIAAQVEPSVLIRPGVFVAVNDHVQTTLLDPTASKSIEEFPIAEKTDLPLIAGALKGGWEAAQLRSDAIITKVASLL